MESEPLNHDFHNPFNKDLEKIVDALYEATDRLLKQLAEEDE